LLFNSTFNQVIASLKDVNISSTLLCLISAVSQNHAKLTTTLAESTGILPLAFHVTLIQLKLLDFQNSFNQYIQEKQTINTIKAINGLSPRFITKILRYKFRQ
jgi:hypothetical protein